MFYSLRLPFVVILLFLSVLNNAAAPVDAQNSEVYDREIERVERHIALFHVSDEDFQSLGSILESRPDDSYAHFLLGRCFERNGLLDMASEQFKLADKFELKPEDTLKRLRHHIEAGEFSEAFNRRTAFWKKMPDNPTLQFLNALFLQENGSQDSAEMEYKALLSCPDCPIGVASALANIKMERGQISEAIELAEEDLKINPDYVAAILVKGEALLASGRVDESISTIKKALEEHPFNRRLNLIMYKACRRKGHYEEALRCALFNLAGSDWISFFEGAKERVRQVLLVLSPEKSDKIVKEVSKDIDRSNYAMKFHFYLGQVYFSLRRGPEALQQNGIACRMDPEFQPNWYEKGRIESALFGDFRAALEDFQKAFKMQRYDYDKSYLAYHRMRLKSHNEHRDIALKIKEALRGSCPDKAESALD